MAVAFDPEIVTTGAVLECDFGAHYRFGPCVCCLNIWVMYLLGGGLVPTTFLIIPLYLSP